jgi:hypothetical protein
MHTILHLIETPGQFQELGRLARLLGQSRQVKQLFLVYDCGAATGQILGGIAAAGGECLNAGGPAENETRRRALDATPSLVRGVLRLVRDTLRAPHLLAGYRRLLRDRAVDLVIVAEDNVAGRSRPLVEAATRAGVPVLLLPFTIPNPREAARLLGHRREYQVRGPLARLFARRRPAWVLDTPGGPMFKLPLPQAMMAEMARLAPRRPWIDNEGPALIALESRAMVNHYEALGFSLNQLVLTGSLSDETIEAARRERMQRLAELRRRFGLSDRPLLLCALPPDQFAGGIAISEFSTYGAVIEAWTHALAAVSDRFAVLVRPHPRIAEPALEPVRRAGLSVCYDDTATLVPLCDLYVASISATIRWALACGIPAVNYDVFQYRLDDYKDVPGIVNVNDLASFKTALDRLAGSPQALATLTAQSASVAADWGRMDGGSAGRILALVDRLIATRDQPA